MNPLLKPAPLRPGDAIGIVSPSGAFAGREDRWPRLEAYLKELGYRPVFGPSATKMRGYLAGTDAERLSDFMSLWADPDIKAVFSSQGGYGSMRLLDGLDYDLIRRTPKIWMGYSDSTALLMALYTQANLVVFHGPQALSDFGVETRNPFTMEHCWPVLQGEADGRLPYRVANALADRYRPLRPGTAEGRLVAANLQVLLSLAGTPYFPDLTGCILLLEDVAIPIYILDRMLTQLRLTGIPDRLAGLVFGEFIHLLPGSPVIPLNLDGAPSLEQLLEDFARRLSIPVGYGFGCGHSEAKATLPVGVQTRFDADRGELHLLEPALEQAFTPL